MRSSRLLFWRLPLVIASAATLLFLSGFWVALRGSLGAPLGSPPPAPSAGRAIPKPAGRRLLLVLGDSLARGTGDETGRGFAQDVQDAMKKGGPTEIANLSVNGAESSELRELCAGANVRSLAASADVILVSIGGNDLSHAVPRGPEPSVRTLEDVTTARTRYAENLRAIVGDLRRGNASARVLLLELYDPFGSSGPGLGLGRRGPNRGVGHPPMERRDLGDGARISQHRRGADVRPFRRKAGPARQRSIPSQPRRIRAHCRADGSGPSRDSLTG